MPAAEHAPAPHPLPIPKDDPVAPKRPIVESLGPLPPSNLVPDPPEQKEKILETEREPSLPEVRPVGPPPPPPEESEPEEEDAPARSLSLIDEDIFFQILDLDDDETHDFSRSMVSAYFEQAEKTFRDMDDAITKKDLPSLSTLGHFLKGSSAALGLSRVKDSCEKIQHSGHQRDEEANKDLTPEEALQLIQKLLKRVKIDYREAEVWLKDFYDEALVSEEEGNAIVGVF